MLFLFSRHILQIDVLASALSSFNLIVKTRIIFKSLNEVCKQTTFRNVKLGNGWRHGHCYYSCIWKLPRLLEIGLLRFLNALVRVIHPDWLIGSNVRLRVSDNLHTDSDIHEQKCANSRITFAWNVLTHNFHWWIGPGSNMKRSYVSTQVWQSNVAFSLGLNLTLHLVFYCAVSWICSSSLFYVFASREKAGRS